MRLSSAVDREAHCFGSTGRVGERGGRRLLDAAIREFQETGVKLTGPYIPLKPVKQKGGKFVHAWAFQGDYEDGRPIVSNTFTIEWPPRSGCQMEFPEIDRADFFDAPTAKRKVKAAQAGFIVELERAVAK